MWKTINGGGNWINQNSDPYALKLFFINKDTGWYCYESVIREAVENNKRRRKLEFAIYGKFISYY